MQASRSFWLEGVSLPAGASLPGDVPVDVAVVGGGFAGLSTAWYLKRKDPALRVAVLEAEHVGYGASGRNAGFAMTLFGLVLELTVLRFGKAKARAAHAFMRRAVDHVGELVERYGVDCDYERSGLLTVATRPAFVKRLQSEIALAEKCGIHDAAWLDADETRARVNSPHYLGARWEPHSALVNPAKLVLGLRRLAREAGAEIYERTPVGAVAPGAAAGSPVRLSTPNGTVTAQKVVLATNAWSATFPAVASRQFPVFTYVVLTEPLSEEQRAAVGWRGREGIEDARCLIHYYRLTPDNRLLMGGGDAYYYMGGGFGQDSRMDTALRLQRDVRALFPALSGAVFSHTWGGPVSVPLDFAPAFGCVRGDPRLIYSLGCVGHGVALMTMAGQVLSDLALERRTELTDLFFVNRFVVPTPPDPLRWAVAQLIRQGMHVADALDER